MKLILAIVKYERGNRNKHESTFSWVFDVV